MRNFGSRWQQLAFLPGFHYNRFTHFIDDFVQPVTLTNLPFPFGNFICNIDSLVQLHAHHKRFQPSNTHFYLLQEHFLLMLIFARCLCLAKHERNIWIWKVFISVRNVKLQVEDVLSRKVTNIYAMYWHSTMWKNWIIRSLNTIYSHRTWLFSLKQFNDVFKLFSSFFLSCKLIDSHSLKNCSMLQYGRK